MYCAKCGKELTQENCLCDACTTNNSACLAEKAESVEEKTAIVKKKNKKTIIIVSVAIIVAIALYFIITMPRVNLKYEWGTTYQEIYEKEKISDEWDLGTCYRLIAREDKHEVDDLEFRNTKKMVLYDFDLNKKLYLIEYNFSSPDNFEHRMDIMKDHYGSDYYTETWGYDIDEMDKYNCDYYWWVGDTVIRLDDGAIKYYDENYILGQREKYKELIDYFGK